MALPEGVGHIGPYRVERQLGAGGMGEVYKAFDDRLDRWVAIKRIRPDKEQADDHRVRFRREARAAARLNHSAIVHVYDIFQDGDSDCIVMELVEGRGLDVVLQDGPLTPRRTAEVGRQIAAGLAEAHRKGILHRDLKTENIILSDQGDAKILDFGLAKPMVQGDLDASLTGQGQVVGTSRAMSPEYVGGDEVDHRADLFSLGVLLYEAVTGQSPFKSHNTLATLKRVILHQQPPASVINPTVPEELSELIDGLLEKEPKDRISTAQEVVDRLDEAVFVYGSGSGERPPLSSSRVTQQLDRPALQAASTRRRRMGMAATIALAVVATVAGVLWFQHDPTTQEQLAFEAEDTIIIGDFVNRTGEAVFDEGLDLVFRVGIEQGHYAKVLSESQVNEALQRMELDPGTAIDPEKGIEIAQREGAKAFVVGTIVKVGTAYSLTGEIIDPESGQTVFSESRSESDQGEILNALGDVVEAIRSNLGESLGETPTQRQELAKVTTSDLEALRAYSLGSARLSHGQPNEAVVFFSRAIDLDPEFAMAHAKLGTAHRNASRDVEGATQHYQRALQFSERLTTSEELYVKGWIATWLRSPVEMIDAWKLMTELVPDSFEAHHNLGMTYWSQFHRFEEAREALQTASRLEQASAAQRQFATYHLGFCQLALGDTNGALTSFESTEETVSPIGLALAHLISGEDALVEQALERNHNGTRLSSLVEGSFVQTLLRLKRGQLDEAYELANTNIGVASTVARPHREMSFRLLTLAIRSYTSGTKLSNESFDELIDRIDVLTREDAGTRVFSPAPTLALAGKIAARNSQVSIAKRFLAAILREPNYRDFPLRFSYAELLRGEIAAATGELGTARQIVRDALETFDSIQIRESEAWLAEKDQDLETAIEALGRINDYSGRVAAECREGCGDQGVNMLIHALSPYHLGRLYEIAGDNDSARAHWSDFLEKWKGSSHSAVEDARQRMNRLGAL